MPGNIGVTYNNPGNLTVNAPGQFLYPGQIGTYSSPNGLTYATFPTPQAGSGALVSWLQNNLGTDPATSLSNLGDTLGYYLNGSFNGVSNSANNPNAVSYAAGAAASLGLGLGQNFTAAQLADPSFLSQIGGAIAKQEGTSSVYSPGLSTSQSLWDQAVGIIDQPAALLNDIFGGNTPVGAGATQTAAQTTAQANATGGLFGPLIDWFNGLIKGFETGVGGFLERGGFIIVGLILIAAGIIYIAASNKTVQQVAVAAVA